MKIYLIVSLIWVHGAPSQWVLKNTFRYTDDGMRQCQTAGSAWLTQEARPYIEKERARGLDVGAPYACLDEVNYRYQMRQGRVAVIEAKALQP
jgi:hypothetical protein